VRSITAAGDKIQPRRDANTLQRLRQNWQQRSFAYYDALARSTASRTPAAAASRACSARTAA
jgi:hypothetical protein